MSIETKILMLKGEKGDPGGAEWGNISGNLSSQTDLKNELDNKANSADIGPAALTNDYNDLNNKPFIPSKTSDITNDSGFVVDTSLSTVATSGSYTDLTNKPTQLTDFSGVLPLTQGGTGSDNAVGARTNLNVYKEYVLFDNETGTHQNITLSDSVLNYEKIGIYYFRYHTQEALPETKPPLRGSREVYVYSQSSIPVSLSVVSNDESNHFNECTCMLTLSGTSANFSKNESFTFHKKDQTLDVSDAIMADGHNVIKIYKVVGYKY